MYVCCAQIKTSSSEILRALSVPTDVDTELVMTLLDSGADLSVKDEVMHQISLFYIF